MVALVVPLVLAAGVNTRLPMLAKGTTVAAVTAVPLNVSVPAEGALTVTEVKVLLSASVNPKSAAVKVRLPSSRRVIVASAPAGGAAASRKATSAVVPNWLVRPVAGASVPSGSA